VKTAAVAEITPESIAAAFPGVPVAEAKLDDTASEPKPLPYDAAFINDNMEKFQPFFREGGVLLFTQDGHWVFGHSFTIAPALIQRGANPETQVKVFLVIGDTDPRVDEQGRILVRKPAQVYQACQVPLAALLPAGFMRSQIVQAKNKIITPG
jgi:hypothetical protein